MDQMIPYDAICFPSDDRPPHLVSLMTTVLNAVLPNPPQPYRCGRMPHPEIHIDYIAEGLGPRSWQYHLVEALDGMNKKFTTPYILFYPIVSRDGMPFPVNKCIREIQGACFNEAKAWRGNIVVAKYRDADYSQMAEASMADFPILKNYLKTCPAP
ncbi:hypothetical protein BKA93DRAFT_136010 [Sparassis latifolia]|uniref:Uncharacterized protein n=1 Tax=Sparassis crispa TaxID=139825 RepID=A0A401GAL9_9APHY|nr:hypothetical protein SCP_0204020 [Sparassis crispa]GBE79205.1 hypothetical protein SCP_0204020 [Sparassis crispa]